MIDGTCVEPTAANGAAQQGEAPATGRLRTHWTRILYEDVLEPAADDGADPRSLIQQRRSGVDGTHAKIGRVRRALRVVRVIARAASGASARRALQRLWRLWDRSTFVRNGRSVSCLSIS